MIFGKFWAAFRAQVNKLANFFFESDPVAQMRFEYDRAVEELKDGRKGLEMHRGLVERVTRQVREGEKQIQALQAQAKAYLQAGDRETAGRVALEMRRAKEQLEQNSEQLDLHEKAYDNNLAKIRHANGKLSELREKIDRYDADLRMSEAEAEIARLSQSFEMNVTTDFGQIEQVIQRKIDRNRGTARVAADLSAKGLADIEAERKMEKVLAEDALRDLEVDLGLRAPETAPPAATAKDLGPAKSAAEEQKH